MPAVEALVAECARRSAVCWLSWEYDDAAGHRVVSDRLVWHAWHDQAVLVVSGDGPQHLPGLGAATRATVTFRGKETRARVVTAPVEVEVVHPDDPAWETCATALLAVRLNLPDPDATREAWRTTGTVVRLRPAG